jgi:hypothetical protein
MLNVKQDDSIQQSLWKLDDKSNWRLVFGDEKANEGTTKQSELALKTVLDTLSSRKKLKLGSLVMTPKGIGRLIGLENGNANVKLQSGDNEQIAFSESEVDPELDIYICIKAEVENWYRLRIPANGTVETIKQAANEVGILNSGTNDFVFIYNGEELKDELFLDQLNVRNNAKFLLCQTKMTQFKVSRYVNTYTWWYFSGTDGITFTSNKKIKLGGLGLYGSHESKVLKGTLKVFEGNTSDKGNTLYDELVEVPASSDQNNAITMINFKKPVTIKADTDYTIQLDNSGEYVYIYYGSGSKATIEGEKGVVFTIKYTPGSSWGSSVESGNFPELIYYA